MAFANSIILYNCKLNHNGLFVCDFGGSGATRDSVMNGSSNLATVKFSYGSMTYMRKDKVIVVDENADVLDAAGVNYCRYINPDFSSSMYFYAFIDQIEYVAPKTTRLHIRTDCFTTYFDRIVHNQCFVEREHVPDDTPYTHTLPEAVGTGELIRMHTIRLLGGALDTNNSVNWLAAFNVATDPAQLGLGSFLGVVSVGGTPSGTWWYGVSLQNAMLFTKYLTDKDATILSISIMSIYAGWINDGMDISVDGNPVHVYYIRDIQPAESGWAGNISIDAHYDYLSWTGGAGQTNQVRIHLDNYIAEHSNYYNNNKLLCYPYSAFELFTYDGSSTTLIPQDNVVRYQGGTKGIEITDTIVSGYNPSETAIVAIATGTFSEVAPFATQSFSSFPTMAVSQDAYASFVARNANSLKFQKDIAKREGINKVMTSAIDLGNAASSGNIGGFVNGLQSLERVNDSIEQINAKMADQKNAPDSIAGHASDGALFILNRVGVFFGAKRINADLMRAADSYFDRYGYAVNITKTPQWNSRPKFNYLKTAGSNIAGQIPEGDKEVINQLFDTGITVWHTVGDYGIYDGANNLAPTR